MYRDSVPCSPTVEQLTFEIKVDRRVFVEDREAASTIVWEASQNRDTHIKY